MLSRFDFFYFSLFTCTAIICVIKTRPSTVVSLTVQGAQTVFIAVTVAVSFLAGSFFCTAVAVRPVALKLLLFNYCPTLGL